MQRRRQVALVIVRSVALIMLVYGVVHVLWGIGAGLGMSRFDVARAVESTLSVFWNDNWSPFWHGFGVGVPGFVLMLIDRRIVRWLVPMPLHECPQCAYPLKNLKGPRCPECGTTLAADGAKPSTNEP